MDLRGIWPLLPAFQAVAECEHLPTAAERLGVTPSALSRAVAQLETRTGVPLFDRSGRTLRLNEAGRQLRAGAEAAMRAVDAALRGANDRVAGPVHVCATGATLTALVLPVLEELRDRFPEVVPWLHGPAPSDQVAAMLADGRLDLALLEHPRAHDALELTRLWALDYGVYCGPGHPLYDRADAGEDEVLRHPFVGATIEEGDRFPPELRANVAIRVYQMALAMDLCASGRFLTVLPRRVVEEWPHRRLWRVPHLHLPPGALFLVHRRDARTAAERELSALLVRRARLLEP